MFPRVLLFAALMTIVAAAADPAFARPRRRAVAQYVPTRTVAESRQAATEPIRNVVHPVADLIVPIPSRPNLDVEPLPGPRTAKIFAFDAPEIEVPPVASRPDNAEATPSKRRSNTAPAAKRMQATPLPIANGDARSTKLMPGQTTESLLMELVKSTVAPESWVDQGGNGTIQFYPLGMSLVINQTRAVQEEVSALLAALRRLQDIEAAVEVRVVTTTPAAFEKACKEMNFKRVAEKDNPAPDGKRTVAPKGKRWTTFIDNDEVRQLLTLLQADRATTVIQAPKVTMANGQNIALNATEDRFFLTSIEVVAPENGDDFYFVPNQLPWVTGLSVGLQSVVAADHQSVRVQLKGYWCQLAGPVELQPVETRTKAKNDQGKVEEVPFRMHLQKPKFAQVRLDEELNIPDGGVALVSCGVVPMEVECDDLVARLSRLCGCDAKTTSAERHVFFLVTPRVIINEEEEFLALPQVQPIPRP